MAFGSDFNTYLYHYGITFRIPYPVLRKVSDIVDEWRAGETVRRRRAAASHWFDGHPYANDPLRRLFLEEAVPGPIDSRFENAL